MALIVFRSRAASAFIMQPDVAQKLLELIGKPMAERGVITVAQIDEALMRLEQAVERERVSGAAQPADDESPDAPVGLGRRAFPLIQMLRAARAQKVDVMWGI